MRRICCAVACATAIFLSATAQAGTWTQAFLVRGGGSTFDQISVTMATGQGSSFDTPALDLGGSGWTATQTDAFNAAASGSGAAELPVTIAFTGSKALPVTFDFAALLDGSSIENTTASWNGSSWSFDYHGAPAGRDLVAVPTPQAASMGLAMLGALGGFTWLRRRKMA
jgi:hypothetical protein